MKEYIKYGIGFSIGMAIGKLIVNVAKDFTINVNVSKKTESI